MRSDEEDCDALPYAFLQSICRDNSMERERRDKYLSFWRERFENLNAVKSNRTDSRASRVRSGIGTRIHELLDSVGVKQRGGCGCKSMQQKLDMMSADEALKHRREIERHINSQAAKLSLGEKLTAFAKAAARGVLINPINPARSILNHVLRRARRGG